MQHMVIQTKLNSARETLQHIAKQTVQHNASLCGQDNANTRQSHPRFFNGGLFHRLVEVFRKSVAATGVDKIRILLIPEVSQVLVKVDLHTMQCNEIVLQQRVYIRTPNLHTNETQ